MIHTVTDVLHLLEKIKKKKGVISRMQLDTLINSNRKNIPIIIRVYVLVGAFRN